MLRKLTKKNQKGFTLIELMIVIAIIGILAAIAIPNFLAYRTKGQNSAAQSEAKNFYQTSMAYFADTTTLGGTVVPSNKAGGFIPSPDVRTTNASAGLHDQHDGTVTVVNGPLEFYHSKSSTSYRLLADGSISALTP
jgi:type IV pilus assembly protein PilA